MSSLMMSTLSAVLQKHGRKLHPVWNQLDVRKTLKVNVFRCCAFFLGICCRHSETFWVFFQEAFVSSRRQSRERRLRILQLLRGVALLPAQGSSSSAVLLNTLTLLFYLSCDLLSVGRSDSDSEMEMRLKEAAVSVQDLLPAPSAGPSVELPCSKSTKKSKEVADGDERHVVKKKKKKKKGQKDSVGSPHHAQRDGEQRRSEQEAALRVRRKKKREGNTEEEVSD